MSDVHKGCDGMKGLWFHGCNEESYAVMLHDYHQLLKSCYGPRGSAKIVISSGGKHFYSASSSYLSTQLRFNHPTIKFINALIEAQNNTWNDFGLFVGILCSSMLFEAEALSDFAPHRVSAQVSSWIMKNLLDMLCESEDEWNVSLDLRNLNYMFSVVKTCFTSKSIFKVTEEELMHLCIKVLQAFLLTVPSSGISTSFGEIFITELEGGSLLDAEVFEGILYPSPELPVDEKKTLHTERKNLKILLFSVPLTSEAPKSDIIMIKETQIELVLLQKLRVIIKRHCIDILASQKVIHPLIKNHLEQDQIIVIDRLGTSQSKTLAQLCHCVPLSSLTLTELNDHSSYIGQVKLLNHIVRGGKSYIHLSNAGKKYATLLLPGIMPSLATMLKELVETGKRAMHCATIDGKLVPGGGCMESWAACIVYSSSLLKVRMLAEQFDTSAVHVAKVVNMCIKTLMQTAVQLAGGHSALLLDWQVDSKRHHLWWAPSVVTKYKVGNASGLAPEGSKGTCGKESTDSDWDDHCACRMLTRREMTKDGVLWKCANSIRVELMELSDCKGVDFQINEEWKREIIRNKSVKYQSSRVFCETIRDSSKFGIYKQHEKCLRTGNLCDHKNQSCVFPEFCETFIVDCYSAKIHAYRLAIEGFMQLFQVGVCIFDK